MQCKRYISGNHIFDDLNMNSSGNNCRPHNAQYVLINNGFTQQPVASNHEPFYEMELIKQTILEQEAMFRDQVKELHRLYKLQTDIMKDFQRKQLRENCIDPNASNLGFFHFETSNEHSLKAKNFSSVPWDNDIIRPCLRFNKGKGKQLILENGGSLEDSRLLRSKNMFPASEYVCSEEKKRRFDVNVGPTIFPKKISEVLPETDNNKLLDRNDGSSSKFKFLFDLNEPVPLEEMENEESFYITNCVSKTDIPLQKQTCFDEQEFATIDTSQVDPKEDQEHPRIEKSWDKCKIDGSENNGMKVSASFNISELHQIVPYSANSELNSISSLRKSTHDVKRDLLAIQALPCFKSSAGLPKSRKQGTNDNIIVKNRHHGDQYSLKMRKSDRKSSSRILEKIDLEAPISPENEECLPPRKVLDKNDKKYLNPEKDLVKIAAEAIVSISSCRARIRPSLDGDGGSLHWFAGVVLSIENSLENEVCDQIGEIIEGSGTFQKNSACTQGRRNEVAIEESCLVGWGKIARKRRGQRCPNTNRSVILR